MILLTPDLRYALRANAICSAAAQARDMRFDPVPVVKFFNPLGAGTKKWFPKPIKLHHWILALGTPQVAT